MVETKQRELRKRVVSRRWNVAYCLFPTRAVFETASVPFRKARLLLYYLGNYHHHTNAYFQTGQISRMDLSTNPTSVEVSLKESILL